MIRSIIILLLAVLAVTPVLHGETVYTLIQEGHLGEARDSLSRLATAASRDGNTLFYQSLLETDANQAARLMQAALNASVAVVYQEEIYYRLAQYYLLTRDYQRLGRHLADYHSRWEAGRYQGEMLRLSVLRDELAGDYDAALQECDHYLVRHSSGETEQWGQVDKARIMTANKKSIGSSKTLRALVRARSGGGIPQALYLLGMEAVHRNRIDDAVFYYNLIREGYPSAVGLDELMEKLGGMSTPSSGDNAAEQLTGTYYSIKVGVFSSKSNAEEYADEFERYDRGVEIRKKEISGKEYHVVYVGRFQDYAEASRFKLQLEAAHHEAFQVVTR